MMAYCPTVEQTPKRSRSTSACLSLSRNRRVSKMLPSNQQEAMAVASPTTAMTKIIWLFEMVSAFLLRTSFSVVDVRASQSRKTASITTPTRTVSEPAVVSASTARLKSTTSVVMTVALRYCRRLCLLPLTAVPTAMVATIFELLKTVLVRKVT